MHHILLQPPTDDGRLARPRYDELPVLPSDQTRDASPSESQTTLVASPTSLRLNNKEGVGSQSTRHQDLHVGRTRWWYNIWTAYQTQTWSMFFFLITGTLFAISHHLFYSHLNEAEAKDQSLMLRYGTILAFCAKANLYTAVIIAFRQRAWMVLRRKIVRLGVVDSIFTAAEDLAALFDWKAIQKAKVTMLLAAYVWATPLIVVLTSETLSVVGGIKQEDSLCPSARTINFTNEEFIDFREVSPGSSGSKGGLGAQSLNIWNTTSFELDALNDKDPFKFDYWARPISWCHRLVQKVGILGHHVARENAGREICSDSWNCSYVVDFIAPGYMCEKVASGIASPVKLLGNADPPFEIDTLLPTGNHSYLAYTSEGEYQQQIDGGDYGMPLVAPPYPPNLGAFRTEPILWIGYSEVNDTDVLQPKSRSSPGWYDAYTPIILRCEYWEMNYTVEFNYTNGFQSYDVKNRKNLRKVINTTFVRNKTNADGTMDNTTAVPESNFVFPKDVRRYRRTAAYHALGFEFRAFLRHSVTMFPEMWSDSDVYGTPLITKLNSVPVKNLGEAIRNLFEDVLVSLLSEPEFVAVSWANNGQASGGGPGGPETNYSCIRRRPTTFFSYNKSQAAQLCTVYAVSIVMALAAVLLGLQAAREEGVMHDMKPSSMIEATRASSLYEVQSNSPDQDFKGLRVGFGWVQEPSGGSIRGFGVEGDVAQGQVQPQKNALWKSWFRRPKPSAERVMEEVRA
ncbi:hypothetical protein B0T10DRAFT_601651 [Thelonectria olida]|uniref:Uncharacterized protein n=1 Tax=Thelonectria olida TaxID=1576542 RepID=A0A9P8WH44_9HYPO|nr:hypothetical protein B0T10DRAFT_601651 [Thelonectria olida]